MDHLILLNANEGTQVALLLFPNMIYAVSLIKIKSTKSYRSLAWARLPVTL